MKEWVKGHAVELVFGLAGVAGALAAFFSGVWSLFVQDPWTMFSLTSTAFALGFLLGLGVCLLSGRKEAMLRKKDRELELSKRREEVARKFEDPLKALTTPQASILQDIRTAQGSGPGLKIPYETDTEILAQQLEEFGMVSTKDVLSSDAPGCFCWYVVPEWATYFASKRRSQDDAS